MGSYGLTGPTNVILFAVLHHATFPNLCSTFADKFLETLNDDLLEQYDTLINEPSNDWDIYYWVTGAKETPQQYDNKVMAMLKKHARNEDMEVRIRQPDLKF